MFATSRRLVPAPKKATSLHPQAWSAFKWENRALCVFRWGPGAGQGDDLHFLI